MRLRVDEIEAPHDGAGAPWPLRPRDLAVDAEEIADVVTLLRLRVALFDAEMDPIRGELARRALELALRLKSSYGDHERWRTFTAANKRPPMFRR